MVCDHLSRRRQQSKSASQGRPPKNYDEQFFLQYTHLKFMSQHFFHEKIYPTLNFLDFSTTMKPSKKFTESEKMEFPDVPPKKLRWAIFFTIYTPQIHVPTLFLLENLWPNEFLAFFDDRKTFQKIYREWKNAHVGLVCHHLSRRRLKLFFLREAAGIPKVGLKPCLPCAFWGGLWSFKPSAPAIKICPPGAPPKKLRYG